MRGVPERLNNPAAIVGALALAVMVTACGRPGEGKRLIAGGAAVSGAQEVGPAFAAPDRVYVQDFTVAQGAIAPASGPFAGATEAVGARPRILGRRGVVDRRREAERPSRETLIDMLAAAITDGLNQQNLGFPAQRISADAPTPRSGWIVRGQFQSVDPGSRAARAVVGFGVGEATAEVSAEVDRIDPSGLAPILLFGASADSGKAPGAVVTLNPYVAAAKFVVGRNATARDITKMGQAIAKEIADYARSKETPSPNAPASRDLPDGREM